MPNKSPSWYDINKDCVDAAAAVKEFTVGDGTYFCLSVEDQIGKIFNRFPEMLIFDTLRAQGDNFIDLPDGAMLQREKSHYKDCIYLILNADGVASRHKSKGYHLWPISASIVNLPPVSRMRSENVILFGTFYGRHKPDPLRILSILIREIKLNDIING